jgi:putative hemolysin
LDPEPALSFFLLPLSINSSIFVGLILMLFLLLCSALISGVEVALFSLNKTQLNDEDSKQQQIIVNLLKHPKKLLATILVANNFINIAIVILLAYLSNIIFEDADLTVYFIGISLNLKLLFDILIATTLILFFGEILPKIYASRNNLKFALYMAYPLKLLDVVFTPISTPMQSITLGLQKRLGRKKTNLSVDQLSHALELTSEDDTTKQEQKILQGIVSFGNTETRQVMRPRIDIFALEKHLPFAEIIPDIIKNGYSRIPVFNEHIDDVVGVLYVKDLLPYLDQKTFDWNSLIRDPFFVPENKKLDDLMLEFQEKKVHLAIVVDEYGGTSGVVSLEDIIEEIVGDISDEFDDDDLIYSKLDDKNYVFEGKTALKDFYKVIKLSDESIFENYKGEAETIAGFVLEISGSFPKPNSKINHQHFVFTIEALDKKRIKRIKVTLP